jgi:hypothetical protein
MEEKAPLYRGLQKPLVLFGMKGSNIYWAAGGFIGGLMALVLGLTIINIWIGLLLMGTVVGIAIKEIVRSYTKGLNRKKEYPGEWMITLLISPTRNGIKNK